MWHLLLFMNFFSWALLSEADICSDLPEYSLHGTSCFKFYTVTKNWAAAEASCVADGGHLASIHSSEEQNFVRGLMTSTGDAWIGLTGTPPVMAWSDGTEVDYDNWSGSEPDDPWRSCTRIYVHRNYAWQDIPCNKGNKYVCRNDNAKYQRKTTFTKIPDSVTMDTSVVPSSSLNVQTALGCARRCQQDAQCVHFIMSEDGGKYLCETYSSLYRSTTTTPPTDNYQRLM